MMKDLRNMLGNLQDIGRNWEKTIKIEENGEKTDKNGYL